MNEKYVEALEQYDMEVRAVRKGRGSWICETDQGCRLLKEYRGTARRLEFEDEVLGRLDTRGSLRADRYLRNREGGLMTVTSDGTRYILKDWFLDRECNIKDGYEIRQALSRLAMLHSQLRTIEFKEEWSMGSILSGPLEEELERHNREMQRARNYIRSKRKKSEFELCVIGSYQMFYDQALEAVQGIRERRTVRKRTVRKRAVRCREMPEAGAIPGGPGCPGSSGGPAACQTGQEAPVPVPWGPGPAPCAHGRRLYGHH